MEPRADLQLAGLVREVVGREGVLEERLDAGDHHPGPTAAPRGERCDPGRSLVGHEFAPFVGQGGTRFEDRHGGGIPQPRAQLLRDAVADLGVPGDPDERLPVASVAAR